MDRKKLRKIFLETDILPWLRLPASEGRIGSYWRRTFLHQLSACVDAGIGLPMSLEICTKEGVPRRLKRTMHNVRTAIEEGGSLSEALKDHARWMFPGSYYGVIEIGERSGTLAEALKILDRLYEDVLALRSRIVGAMLYPVLVFLICIGLIGFMLVRVIPTFAEVFADLAADVPFPTRVLVAMSDFIRSHVQFSLVMLGCTCSAMLLFAVLARRVTLFSRMSLRIPVFGPLAYHSNLFYFSSMMSILLESGTPTHEALSLCDSEAMWPVFRVAIREMARDVCEGKDFSVTVSTRGIFSQTFVWLTSVGERRGDLADSFKALSEFELARIRHRIELLPRLFQPVTVILMSLVIGFVIIAMWLPVINMPYLLLQ